MTLTCIVDPSEKSHRDFRSAHLEVLNDPFVSLLFGITRQLSSFRSSISFLDCLSFAHVLATFGLTVPFLVGTKYFPELVFTQT